MRKAVTRLVATASDGWIKLGGERTLKLLRLTLMKMELASLHAKEERGPGTLH